MSVVRHHVFFFWTARRSHLEPGLGQLATKATGEVETHSWLTGVIGGDWQEFKYGTRSKISHFRKFSWGGCWST